MSLLSFNKKNVTPYMPKNSEKFVGDIVYCRSKLEQKFARWCDLNDVVTKWSNESLAIPYFDNTSRKFRKYYPDFTVEIAGKTYIIEIKMEQEAKTPVRTAKKSKIKILKEMKIYDTNIAKWSAAIKYCQARNCEFKIITDKMLGSI